MLAELLEGNARHVDHLADDHFEDVQDGQSPQVVTLCCSDSRVPAEGMWAVDRPGWAFTVEGIGNQASDLVDGEPVVDGSLLYPVAMLGTRTIAVVGHTGCGAIAAARDALEKDRWPDPPGIREKIARLVERLRSAYEVEKARDPQGLELRLVEHNVHEQVAFLTQSTELPQGTRVLGFVYDLHQAYAGPPGRAVLVNVDGERDPDALGALVPEKHRAAVGTLL